jgi:hypothetical protein
MMGYMKTKEQILEQIYISPQDLKILVPSLGIDACRKFIDEARKEMQEKNYFVPQTKPKLALTKIVKKMIGI